MIFSVFSGKKNKLSIKKKEKKKPMSDLGTVVWKSSSGLLPFRTPVFHLG